MVWVLFPVGSSVVGIALNILIDIRRIRIKGTVIIYRDACIYHEPGRCNSGRAINIAGIRELVQISLYFFQSRCSAITQVEIILFGIYFTRPVGPVLFLKIDGIVCKSFVTDIYATVDTGNYRKPISLTGNTGTGFVTGIFKPVLQYNVHYAGNSKIGRAHV